MFKKSFSQKLAISFLLLSLTVILISPALLVPQPARAQMVVTDPGQTAVAVTDTIWKKIVRVFDVIYKKTVPVLFKSGINLVLNNMARDTANYLASGAKGEKPAFLTDPHYWTKMGDAVGGEFINTLAQSTGFINQSLCDPIDPTIKLKMLTNLNKNLSKETLLRNASNTDKTKLGIFDPSKSCSLSKINQRLKEASKKKLFAFDTKLNEGSLKKYLTDLTVLINTDPKIMGTPAQKDLQIICGVLIFDKNEYEYGLAKQQTIAQDIIKQIKKINKAKESEKKEIKSKIENILKTIAAYRANEEEIKANHYPVRTVDSGSVHPLDYFSKVSQYCLTLNKEDLVGVEDHGYTKCADIVGQVKCSGDINIDCQTAWKRIKLYSNQAIKWQEQLAQLTKSLIDDKGELVLPNEEVVTSLADAQKALSPENSDVGIELSMSSNLDSFITNKVTNKKLWDQINTAGGITSMNTAISNIVKTPSALVKKAGEKNVENADTSLKTYTGDLLADTANVFMGTLMSQLVKQIFETGFNKETDPDSATKTKEVKTTTTRPPPPAGDTLFAGLSRANLQRGGAIDVLQELLTCPDNPRYRQVNNCVIDQNFFQAIQQQKTIKQAVTDGDIDLSLDRNNINEILTKIKILRANRIVPLGLEIAANLVKEDPSLLSHYSLQQIIDEFDVIGSDFYHLVDPNWVLKAPASRCQIKGYGNLPLYGSTERQEVCLDRQNCIDEAEDGSCLTYGYCVAEKKIWRFQGDSCDQQFTSCLGYQRQSDGQSAYYLADTLDNRGCDERSAGCQQYNSNYAVNSGSWIDLEKDGICPYSGGCHCQIPFVGSCVVLEESTSCDVKDNNNNTIGVCNLTNPYYSYFNQQVERCSAKAVGCHEYIRNQADLGTNLVLNNSFTDFVGEADDELTDEKLTDVFAPWTNQEINSVGQSMTATYAVSDGYQDRQAIKIVTGEQAIAKGITQIIAITPQNYPRYFTASVYIKNQENFTGIWNLLIQSDNGETVIAGDNQWNQDNYNWQRYWQTIEVLVDAKEITLFIGTSFQDSTAQGSILVDGVQLVETSQPIMNEFDLPVLTDYGQINQVYLRQSPAEINCDLNSADYNSLACENYALTCQPADVGCQFYSSAVGTTKIPAVVNPNDTCPSECVGYDSYYQSATLFENSNSNVQLIPNGQVCPAQEVGCEEFTNLEKLASGGEAKEYYSYIRPCQKPDEDACQAYYTWVGSDAFGYQLKKYILRAGVDGPDKISVDETLYGQCNNETDAMVNPHCRVFYDSTGKIYPTTFETTITCSENCQQLRKTTQIGADDCWLGLPNSASYQEIDSAKGTGICTFSALPEQSRSCLASSVGCREYKGNNANQVVNILSDDFESEDLEDTPNNWTNGSISSASVQFPGKSLSLTASAERSLPLNKIIMGESYLVTFWAKGKGNGILYIDFDNDPDPVQSFGSVALTDQWQSYRLGPVVISGSLPTKIIFSGFTNLYLDNFVLQQNSNLYFIKDSWQIPESCIDSTLGCQTYYDATKQAHYLTGFSHLCSDQAVGCEEMVDTHNSSLATEFTFNSENDTEQDDITIPADNKIYLVNDGKKYCSSADKGCQEFGLANYDANGQISDYQDVYLKNNPDKYIDDRGILCQQQQQYCAEFKPIGNAGNSVYFKDPTVNHQLCERREGVIIDGQARNGWFKQGTNQTCYDDYAIKDLNEAGYLGQVGLCSSQQAGCTKFYDPDAEQNYYYLKNNQLDETSCQGRVSKKEGCILFKDNSNPYNYYDSGLTYDASQTLTEKLVIPVNNIDSNDTNIILKVRPDRACAQWEWCRNSFVQQLDNGQTQLVCSQLDLCNELSGHGSDAQCTAWEEDTLPLLLNQTNYINRNISYSGGIDYSGIAVANQYLPDQLQINYNQTNNQFYLDSKNKNGISGIDCLNNNDCPNSSICQLEQPSLVGKCILFPTVRAYAEKDAPFTNSVWDIYHQTVNYCQSANCQDSYYKVGYGTKGIEKRYFDLDEVIPEYVCSELDEDNKAVDCESENDCSKENLGTCMAKSAMPEEKVANWPGYCLERVPNYDQRIAPCLTWLPINVGMDRDLHSPDTGYSPLPNQRWYCVEASDEVRTVAFNDSNGEIIKKYATSSSVTDDDDDDKCTGSGTSAGYIESGSLCYNTGTGAAGTGAAGIGAASYCPYGLTTGIYAKKDGCNGAVYANFYLNETPLTTLPYFVIKQVSNNDSRTLTYEALNEYSGKYTKKRFYYYSSKVVKSLLNKNDNPLLLDYFNLAFYSFQSGYTGAGSLQLYTCPCQTLVKVPVNNSNGMAIAYTNRINNLGFPNELQYPNGGKDNKCLNNYSLKDANATAIRSLYDNISKIVTGLTDGQLTDPKQSGTLYYRQHPNWGGTEGGGYWNLYDWQGEKRGAVTSIYIDPPSDAYYGFADLFPQPAAQADLDWANANYTIDPSVFYYGSSDDLLHSHPDVVFAGNNATSTPLGLSYQLSFYASADANKMPIQQMEINWGDGDIQIFPRLTAMNHKKVGIGKIGEDGYVKGCDGTDFGSLSEQTCVERPLIFQYAYTKSGTFPITVTVWDNWADPLVSEGPGITTQTLSPVEVTEVTNE